MPAPKHTLIVGGGIVGACCAWYLRQSGRNVTIIDQADFGAACSHGNCGYISPSHVAPLPGPGQLLYGLRGLISRNGALRIRPGMNMGLWSWLLKFGKRCNAKDRQQASQARHVLLQSSRTLYEDLIESNHLDVEWKKDGLLFVFRDAKNFNHFSELNDRLTQHFNLTAEGLDGAALAELEPALKPGLAGAFHYKTDAHLRSDRLMAEMRRLLTDAGVKIQTQTQLLKIQGNASSASNIQTDQGDLTADEFVIATGATTPFLNAELGCKIPIQPGKGYSITMPRPKLCPKYPMLLEEVHVGITPFDSGYRIGSTMELAGYNHEMSPERLQYLQDGATEFLQEPMATPVQEEWFGFRPMTWDGLPYIDATPKYKNVWVAAGHNMLGLSMGTATGKLVSELITGDTAHIDPTPYRIGRPA